MRDDLISKIETYFDTWLNSAEEKYTGAKIVLGYNTASELQIRGKIARINDYFLAIKPHMANAARIFSGLSPELQQNFVTSTGYDGNPENYFERLQKLGEQALSEIQTISADTTSKHAASISEQFEDLEKQVASRYKDTVMMCNHLGIMYRPNMIAAQETFLQQFLRLFLRSQGKLSTLTVEEQEYYLKKYRQKQDLTLTASGSNHGAYSFEQEIKFSGHMDFDGEGHKWNYEIKHERSFSDSRETTLSFSMDFLDPWFYQHINQKNSKTFWSVSMKGQDTNSNSEDPNKQGYYEEAKRLLGLAQAKINEIMPGALMIAHTYPVPGTLPIEITLGKTRL